MFSANVVRVLIASPRDTKEERATLRDAIEDWNSLNGEEHGVILLPTMWERDATPEMGESPQRIINRQLVDDCDMVVACFWAMLGTPTEDDESGTVEEIERSIAADKPVMVYFSWTPKPTTGVDEQEYERLIAFRDSLKPRGLFDGYANPDELARKVTSALTRVVRERFGAPDAVDPLLPLNPQDVDLFNELRQAIPPEFIKWLKDAVLTTWPIDSMNPVFDFELDWRDPDHEFLDKSLEELRQQLFDAVRAFANLLGNLASPISDTRSGLSQWRRANAPDEYAVELRQISEAAAAVVGAYEALVRERRACLPYP